MIKWNEEELCILLQLIPRVHFYLKTVTCIQRRREKQWVDKPKTNKMITVRVWEGTWKREQVSKCDVCMYVYIFILFEL